MRRERGLQWRKWRVKKSTSTKNCCGRSNRCATWPTRIRCASSAPASTPPPAWSSSPSTVPRGVWKTCSRTRPSPSTGTFACRSSTTWSRFDVFLLYLFFFFFDKLFPFQQRIDIMSTMCACVYFLLDQIQTTRELFTQQITQGH